MDNAQAVYRKNFKDKNMTYYPSHDDICWPGQELKAIRNTLRNIVEPKSESVSIKHPSIPVDKYNQTVSSSADTFTSNSNERSPETDQDTEILFLKRECDLMENEIKHLQAQISRHQQMNQSNETRLVIQAKQQRENQLAKVREEAARQQLRWMAEEEMMKTKQRKTSCTGYLNRRLEQKIKFMDHQIRELRNEVDSLRAKSTADSSYNAPRDVVRFSAKSGIGIQVGESQRNGNWKGKVGESQRDVNYIPQGMQQRYQYVPEGVQVSSFPEVNIQDSYQGNWSIMKQIADERLAKTKDYKKLLQDKLKDVLEEDGHLQEKLQDILTEDRLLSYEQIENLKSEMQNQKNQQMDVAEELKEIQNGSVLPLPTSQKYWNRYSNSMKQICEQAWISRDKTLGKQKAT